MLTWRLWQLLQIPFSNHPVYKRFRHHSHNTLHLSDMIPLPKYLRRRLPWGFLAGFALVIFLVAGGWVLLLGLIVMIPVIPLTGTLYGLGMAVQVAGVIAREHEQGRYTLLAVTPLGVSGLNWSVCSAVYHRNRTIGQLRDTVRGLYMVMFVVVGLFLFVSVLTELLITDAIPNPIILAEALNASPFAQNSMLLGVFIAALYVDFIQSIVVGTICGMLTPLFARNATNARGGALGLYLMTQFVFYAAVGVVCLVVVPAGLTLLNMTNLLVLSFIQLTIFVVSRELLIMGLWKRLSDEIGADIAELDEFIGQGA